MKIVWRVVSSYRFALAVVVYGLLILGIAWLWLRPDPGGQYLAATPLVRNHRIIPHDLKRPSKWPFSKGWFLPDRGSFEGRYVGRESIGKDNPVDSDKVEVSPRFEADATQRLVVVPLPVGSALVRLLDAGSVVEILSRPKPQDGVSVPTPAGNPEAGVGSSSSKVAPAPGKVNGVGGVAPAEQANKSGIVCAILCDAPSGQDKSGPACYVVLAVPAELESYIVKEKDSIRLVPKASGPYETGKKGA